MHSPARTMCPRPSFSTTFVFALVSLLPLGAMGTNRAAPPVSIQFADNGSATAADLAEALQVVQQRRQRGDQRPVRIQLPAGVHRAVQTLELSPTIVGEGLSIEAAKPGETILTGAKVAKLADQDDSFWRFAVPSDDGSSAAWPDGVLPRVILIDGKLQSPARYPNHGFLRIHQSLPDRRSGFWTNPGDLPDGFELGSFATDLVFLHDWSSSRLPVATIKDKTAAPDGSSQPAGPVLRTVGPIGCSADHYKIDHFEEHPRYWLEGHRRFADLAGEWFIDPETQQIWVRKPTSSAGQSQASPPAVEVPWLTTLVRGSGDQSQPLAGVAISGITVTGTRFPMPEGGYAAAQATMHEPRGADGGRDTSHRPMLGAAIEFQQSDGVQFSHCKFQAIGNTGLWLGGRTNHCKVLNCVFDDIGGNAINLGEDNARRVDGQSWYQAVPQQVPAGQLVRQCQITRCGRVLPGAVAIWAALQSELEITENQIDDCPYTGISLGWLWNDSDSPAGNNHVHDNTITRVLQMLSDGGGIYTLGRQPGSVLESNTITDVPLNAGRAESNGMFLDEGTTGFIIRENTIRRVAKSPLRFHRAGENTAVNNRWTLATEQTPPVRYNATPEENITLRDNQVLKAKTGIYLIGNSLTWDTLPPKLDGFVRWHVDCGKNLSYIADRPEQPCVDSSWRWPQTLRNSSFDFLVVQPFYGTSLAEDVEVISRWIEQQPKATVVVHTGWARQATRKEEYQQTSIDQMVHSPVYFDALLERLQAKYPDRQFRKTAANQLLHSIAEDIEAGVASLSSLDPLYRDAIHMTAGGGRYLMHNAMRQALGQPVTRAGFEETDAELLDYLDGKLREID